MIDAQWFIEAVLERGLDSVGGYMNSVADSFRAGADLQLLVPLLTSPDPQLAAAGAWIASEAVGNGRGREIFHELSQLLLHDDPAVRIVAMSGVSVLVEPSDASELLSLIALLADKAAGVRRKALFVISRLPHSLFADLKSSVPADLMSPEAEKATLLRALVSGNLLHSRLAAVSILRNEAAGAEVPTELRELCDQEVNDVLDAYPVRKSHPGVTRN